MDGNFSARIGAKITEFMAKMKQVQSTIKSAANDVRVDIGADIAKFKRKAAEVKAKALALAREKVVIKIEARIEEFQNKIARIATNIRAFGELMQHTLMGSMMAVFPAIVPLIANVGVAIANLGPMIGTVAGSTFALVGAFAAAGAGAVAFGAVAIPTLKKLFDENAKLNAEQKKAKASFDAFKNTYDGLVKATEKPVLSAFTKAMNISSQLLKTLQPLFVSSAKAVDNLMTSLSKSINTPPVQKFLEYLNTSGAPMLETFGRSFGNIFKGIMSMMTAFAPLSASTAKGFEDMTARFAEWSNGLSGSAKFQAFMDYVNTNMPKIRAIFRDATAGLVYFFSAFGSSASGMMDGLVDMMARLKQWSATLSQNQGFQTFLSYVSQTAPSVLQLIGNLTKFLVNLGIGMAPLGAAIVVLVNKFLEFTNSAMEGNRAIGMILAAVISLGGVLLAVVPNLIAFRTLFKGLGPLISNGVGSALNAITPLFTNFGGVVARAATILPRFGAALGFITSPAALIVAAIAGLIAVFVGLYKTNDTFRAQVQEVWSVIQAAISTAVNAVKDLVMSVWSQITSFWNANQESIKSSASTVWNAIGNVVTTVMTAIGAIMQFVWPVVKALIVSTWNAIQNVIQGVINVILGIIKTFSSLFQGDWRGVWDGVKQILSGAVQAIWGVINLYFVSKLLGPLKAFGGTAKTLMQTAWSAIKGIFTNTLNTIKTVVVTIFNGIKTTITSVMNSIKSLISSIWNAIKSTMSSILNAIKTLVLNIWVAIKTHISNTLNTIKSIVSSSWNAIKSIISSVLNGIKSVITTIWNSVKTFITSVLNGIKSIITSTWNAIKNVISTAMEGVKKAIVDGWNAAKSFLESINLVEIGKNIIQGLVNGIGSMMGAVKDKVAEMANLIPEWAKKILGIHSPSRVMAAIAKWIPAGVGKGIKDNLTPVKAALTDLAKVLIDDIKGTQSTIEKLAKEETAKLTKIETDKAYRINQIRLKAAQAKRALTEAENARIAKIEADSALKTLDTQQKYADKIAAIQEQADNDRIKSVQNFIQQKRELEQINLVEEAAMWKASLDLFEDGTEAKIKAQIQYKNALKAVNDDLATINEKYASKIADVNKNLKDQEEKLTKAYEDALSEREKSLRNFTGVFDAFEVKIDRSGKELVKNLESQVLGFKEWQKEVQILSEKAIDKGLLAELRAMGPAALGELKALNSLSESELNQYSNLYKEKMQLAREEAVTEMEGMKNDTDTQIKSLRENANTELDELKNEWTTAIKSITQATSDGFSSLPEIGANAGQGLLNGLSSMHSAIEAKAREIALSVKDAMEDALDIHSPSRVMHKIGEWTVEGFVNGMASMENAPSKVIDDITKTITDKTKWYADKLAEIERDKNKQIEFLAGSHRNTIYSIDLEKQNDLAALDKEYAEKGLKRNEEYERRKAEILNKNSEWRKKLVEEEAMYVASVEREHADQINSIKDIMQVEAFDALKKSLEKARAANEISALEEMRIWSKAADSFAENSQQKKESIEQFKSAYERALDAVKIKSEELIKQEAAITAEYTKAVNDRAQSIASFASIFDEFKINTEKSGADLMSNLQSQVDAFRSWQESIAALSSKAIDEGLLAELKALGPKAAGELAALNAMTDAELEAYSKLYQEKQALAREQAEAELVGMKEDTEKRIDELRATVQAELDEINAVWKNSSSLIVSETDKELAKLETVGQQAGQGLLNGLASMEVPLINKAQSIADSIKSTIQSALDIHSPSRWADKFIGRNFVQGIINGFAAMQSDAVKAAAELAEWVKPAVDVSDIINDINGAIDTIQTEIEHKVKVNVEIDGQGNNEKGTGVHQEVHLHSPKHLSPSENARQLKRVAQQLAF